MRQEEERVQCPLCERQILVGNMSKHHFLPKSRGGTTTDHICMTCHGQIHILFTNKQIDKEALTTVEALKADPNMQTYLSWVAKRNPDRRFRGRRSR